MPASSDLGRMNREWRRRPHATGAAIERSGGAEARPGAGPVRPAHGGQRHGELRHASGPEKGRRCAEEHYLAAWFVRAPVAGPTLDLETEALSAKRHDIRALAARLHDALAHPSHKRVERLLGHPLDVSVRPDMAH